MCQAIQCDVCGENYNEHQIWCRACGHPVPWNVASPEFRDEPAEPQRVQLYESLLEDLDRLRDTGKISPPEYKPIHRFYRGLLQSFDREKRNQERQQALFRLTKCAREAAQADQFQEASLLFQQADQINNGVYSLGLMEAELESHVNAIQHESQQTEDFDSLLTQAKQKIASHDVAAARNFVDQASQIFPDSPDAIHIREQFNLLETSLQSPPTEAESCGDSNHEDDLIVAKVIGEAEPAKLSVYAPPSSGCDKASSEQAKSESGCPEQTVSEPFNKMCEPSLVSQTSGPEDQLFIQAPSLADLGHPSREPDQKETFDPPQAVPTPTQRLIESTSQWSSMIKPFLLDNVGWFVGAFLVVAGFAVLIVTFWNSIEQNRVLMHSVVFLCLTLATGMFFTVAYFMRQRYPELESSSNVLLVIVALLVPLVFAAALLTSFVPPSEASNLFPVG